MTSSVVGPQRQDSVPLFLVIPLLLWGVFIVYGTTIPFSLQAEQGEIVSGFENLSTPDLVSNVLLFIPWGFLLAMTLAARGSSRWTALVLATITATLLSVFVETLQLFFSNRVTALSDVITNTMGGAIGGVLGWSSARSLVPRVEPVILHWLQVRPIAFMAVLTILGFWLAAASPFDVTLDVDDIKRSVKTLRAVPFGPTLWGEPYEIRPWVLANRLCVWMLAGGLFFLALAEGKWASRRAIIGATIAAGLVTAVGELGQIAIGSRSTDSTEMLVAMIGGGIGAWLASMSPDPRKLAGNAIVIWLVAQAAAALRPGTFGLPQPDELTAIRLLPFIHYFMRTDFTAVADALNQSMSYAPLGVFLRIRNPSISMLAVVLIAGLVALALEAAQLFVVGRVAGATDVILGAAGAAVAAMLWTRATWARDAHGSDVPSAKQA